MIANLSSWVKKRLNPSSLVEVIVFGHQKSGTTVISSLLGELTGLGCGEVEPLYGMDMGAGEIAEQLLQNPKKLSYLCLKYPGLFAHSILKDADAIFIYPEVKRVFKHAKYVFIVRDPRDTIRSVCNRLGLPGDNTSHKITPEDMKKRTRHWELILSSRLPRQSGIEPEFSSYITNLSYRWKLAAKIYQDNSDQMVLIRYEDFIKNKEDSILQLAKSLGLPNTNSISHLVDKQYQAKGNSSVNLKEFFGRENLEKIEEICKTEMEMFNYS